MASPVVSWVVVDDQNGVSRVWVVALDFGVKHLNSGGDVT